MKLSRSFRTSWMRDPSLSLAYLTTCLAFQTTTFQRTATSSTSLAPEPPSHVDTPHPNSWFLNELRVWERKFSKPVVHDGLCLLLLSRNGLTGYELQALLHLTRSQWIAFRASLRPFLKTTSHGFGDLARVQFQVDLVYAGQNHGKKSNVYKQNAILAAERAVSDDDDDVV